ncbi:hypothetical protein ACLQ8T_06065 [Glutamicibacter sp. FR1]|uniref:DNA polymerase III subunit beta family protein n=1 Tax=Glutamicibacter sp. FR1 TaxID=3393744 RepID=UPI0039AF9427
MSTTLEKVNAAPVGKITDSVAVTVSAREILAVLKKVRASVRPPAPATTLTALRFEETGWVSARTFDFEIGLGAELGTMRGGMIHERLVLGNVLINVLTEVVRGAVKDLEVTLQWTWDEKEKISRLQLVTDGFELGVPSALGSSSHEGYFTTIHGWPAPESIKDPNGTALVDVQAFRALIDQVAHAASKDVTLPALTAISIEFSTDRITAAATDRYRVAKSWIPSRVNFSGRVLMLAKDWARIRVLLDKPGDMHLFLAGKGEAGGFKRLRLKGEGFEASTMAYDGHYPKVGTLYDVAWKQHVTISAATMMRAARIISTVTERNTPLTLESATNHAALQITGQAFEAQARSPLVPAEGITEEGIRTAFNPEFYKAALKAVAGDKIRLSFSEMGKPVRVTNGAEPLEQLVTEQMIMPVRLPNPGE